MKPPINELIRIIQNKKGIISDIAKAYGVNRSTAHTWIYGSESKGIEPDEDLMEAVNDARATIVDFAESQAYLLMAGIPKVEKNPKTGREELVGWEEKPDAGMIRYFLSKQGIDRGYGDKLDITSGGKPVKAPFVLVVKEAMENDEKSES